MSIFTANSDGYDDMSMFFDFIDIYSPYVDPIDISSRYVEEIAFHRHIVGAHLKRCSGSVFSGRGAAALFGPGSWAHIHDVNQQGFPPRVGTNIEHKLSPVKEFFQ
jgi:hypothetical protein